LLLHQGRGYTAGGQRPAETSSCIHVTEDPTGLLERRTAGSLRRSA